MCELMTELMIAQSALLCVERHKGAWQSPVSKKKFSDLAAAMTGMQMRHFDVCAICKALGWEQARQEGARRYERAAERGGAADRLRGDSAGAGELVSPTPLAAPRKTRALIKRCMERRKQRARERRTAPAKPAPQPVPTPRRTTRATAT